MCGCRQPTGRDQQAGPPLAAAPLDLPDLGEIAGTINPVVAGWMQYYGRFYPATLYRLLAHINAYLVR